MSTIIKTARITLESAQEEDLPILWKWRNSQDFLTFCTHRTSTPSFEEFTKELVEDFSDDRHMQMIVKKEGQPVGTVYSYGYSERNEHCFVSIYMDPTQRHFGYSVEAFLVFLSFLFASVGLYKVYMDVYEHNLRSMGLMRHSDEIRKEGHFKGHILMPDGQRSSLARFAIYRESLSKIDDAILRLAKTTRTKLSERG